MLVKIDAKVVNHGHVSFQMAEVAVSQQMFQEILSLIARCGHHPRRHEGRWGQMRQTTAAEVRLDATTAERFTASAQSSDRFHRLPRTLARHLPLPETPEGAILNRGMSVRIGVTPAKAGVQGERSCLGTLDSRFRGNDKWTG
jgi:hypothetical protein